MNRVQVNVRPTGLFIEISAEEGVDRHVRSLARHYREHKIDTRSYAAFSGLAALRIDISEGGDRLERDLVFGVAVGLGAVWAVRSGFGFGVESSQEPYQKEGWILTANGWERGA